MTILILMTFMLSGCGGTTEPQDSNQSTNDSASNNVKGDLKISMLNVGQGDAILVQTGAQTILIDTSDTDERALLVSELEKSSVTRIDKLILTHPHADHIGSAKQIINPTGKILGEYPYLKNISVAEVYDNGIKSKSSLYTGYVKAIEKKKIPYHTLKAGDKLDFGNGVTFKVFSPTAETIETVNGGGKKSDPNNESIVGILNYKNFSMMFTGDAEKKTEKEILSETKPDELQCNVLKAGHHGSYSSSSKEFIEAVNPKYVLISAGQEEEGHNTYGHPHFEPLNNFIEQGVDKKKILCTRWNGTIVVTSDGKNFSVDCDKKEDWLDKWMSQEKPQKKK